MEYAKTTAVGAGIALLVVASHVFGAYTVERKLFPYPSVLQQAFSALDVYVGDPTEEDPGAGGGSGVTVNESDAYDGYVFYTPDNMCGAQMRNMSGELVHEWTKRFDETWENPPHVGSGEPSSGAIWRSARLFPNGDVLAVFAMIGATPYGYGLVKLDRQSNVVWRYPQHVNHLVEVDDRGDVYALFHEFRNVRDDPVANNPQLGAQETPKILEDHIVQLTSDGEEKRTFSLLDAIATSQFSPILETYPTADDRKVYHEANWDPMHPNNIEVVTPPLADRVPELDPGDVLVSFRTLDAVVGFDMERERAVWLTRGYWRRQHDPDLLEDGRLLVFDNRGNAGPGGKSRIVSYDPVNGAMTTRYRGTEANPFQTVTSGSQAPLPNGNILITESNRGRIFEVTPAAEVVWEYRAGSEGGRPHVHSATKVGEEWLEFDPTE